MPHIIFPILLDAFVAFIFFEGFLDGVINHASPTLIEVKIFAHFIAIENELLFTFSFSQIIVYVDSCIERSPLQFLFFLSLKHNHEHPLSSLLVFLLLLPSCAITTQATNFLSFQSSPSYQPVDPFWNVVLHL